MCYRCNKLPPTGYRGQKYEVSCLGYGEDETVRHVLGWTNDPTGGAIARMIELHPVWNSPEVREMQQGEENGRDDEHSMDPEQL